MRKRSWLLCLIVCVVLMNFSISALAEAPKAKTLTKLWEVTGLVNTESVAYDAKSDVLYVLSKGTDPKTSFVSKISMKGEMLTKDFTTGLTQGRGIILVDNLLFVTELQALTKIDVATGKVVKTYPVPEAGVFNDLVVDPATGDVYVSDTGTEKNVIYKWNKAKDTFEKWLESPKLEQPNGLIIEKGQLISAPWGVVTDPATWATKVPGHLATISLDAKEIKSLGGKDTPLGNLDGLQADGEGNYFVGDWWTGKLYLVNQAAEATLLLTLEQSIADFLYLLDKKLLFIPIDSKFVAYKVE